MKAFLTVLLLLLSVWLIASGWTDLDWQVSSYRYSEWHRSVDYWEYNPYLRIEWWFAYIINIGRVMAGCFVLGVLSLRLYLSKELEHK
jgi:uncharacterized membrane protein YphA (DoxX/SURF4 family)